MDLSIKYLALGTGYFIALIIQLRVYVKPAAIAVFPVFHVLVILLFSFRCFAFLLAVSYSGTGGIKRLPHPEFEWALYDIGGVIGFAAYMSIAWHMMHVRKWTLARREARRKRRERRAARRRLGASASSTTLDTVPGAGPEADQTYYGVLSSGALEALENRAPMLRNQLCKCNTVVFTSGSAVTFTAAVFVLSYLSMYAIVFLSSEDTKEALYNLHMTLIPTYFIVGGSLVAVVNAVAAIMFITALRNDRVRYPLYWGCCELQVRRTTLLVAASVVGIGAMVAKIAIMGYSMATKWFPFDDDVNSQVWYYPCVDSLPLWLCFELLRPLLRTVPTSSAAEQVLERMYAALELARISDSDSSEEGGRDSATSMLRGAVVQGHLAEVEEVKQVQVTPPAPPSPVVSEVSSPKAVTAKVEEQMVAFQRNVAAFESLVLQNFRDVQSQLAQANRTNRGNAQQLMSLKQMTRIMARMVAIESDRSLVSPPSQGAISGQSSHMRRRSGTTTSRLSNGSIQHPQRALASSSRTVGMRSTRGTYRPPVLASAQSVGSPGSLPRHAGTGSPNTKPRTPAALRAASSATIARSSGNGAAAPASGPRSAGWSAGTTTGVALQAHNNKGRDRPKHGSGGNKAAPAVRSPVVVAVAATGSGSARSYDSAGSGGTSGGGVSEPTASLEDLRQQRLGNSTSARGMNGHGAEATTVVVGSVGSR